MTDVTASIERVSAAGGDGVPAVLALVEARMLELVTGFGEQLARHGTATINAGGKRLRPLLVCLASGVPVSASDALIRAAAAVELIHAATLVHDDVLDDSQLRRGEPTVYASGGRLAATATGDLLFSRAFWELAGSDDVEPVRILSAAASSLAQGELMQRHDAWDLSVSRERYMERCRLKTAMLFRAACELGARAGGLDGAAVAGLGAFGERIGLAFQLFDDVLDVTGPPERTGKPRGADLLDGTVTLPLIVARERQRELDGLDLTAVRTPEQALGVCQLIAGSCALAAVREEALALVADAKAVLPDALNPAQRGALELVADGVVERYS